MGDIEWEERIRGYKRRIDERKKGLPDLDLFSRLRPETVIKVPAEQIGSETVGAKDELYITDVNTKGEVVLYSGKRAVLKITGTVADFVRDRFGSATSQIVACVSSPPDEDGVAEVQLLEAKELK